METSIKRTMSGDKATRHRRHIYCVLFIVGGGGARWDLGEGKKCNGWMEDQLELFLRTEQNDTFEQCSRLEVNIGCTADSVFWSSIIKSSVP